MSDLAKRYSEQIAGMQQGNTGQYGGVSRAIQGEAIPQTQQPQQGGGFLNYAARTIGQGFDIGAGAVGAAGRFIGNSAVDIVRQGRGVVSSLSDVVTYPIRIAQNNAQIDQLNEKRRQLDGDYKAGNISLKDYNERLKGIKQGFDDVGDSARQMAESRSVQERAEDIIGTTVNVLTLGRWSAIKPVANTAVTKSLTSATQKIQDTLLRIPSARELIARNAASIAKREGQRMAGETMEQYVVREGKRVAAGLLIKRPLFYQQNIEDATAIYNGMVSGDYGSALKSAGWMASQMLGGGPIGWFMRHGKQAGVKLRDLSRGRGSFIDKLSQKIGTGSSAQIVRYLNTLQERAPNEYKKSEEIFRIMQETNLRVADERIDDAVENVLRNYDLAGVQRSSITPKMFVDDYSRWYEASKITEGLKGAKIPGLDGHQIDNLVVVRWDSVMKRGLAQALLEAGNDRAAMANVLNEFASRTTNGWGNNPLLMKQLTKIVDTSASAEEVARRIKAMPTAVAIPEGLPKRISKKLADLGYGVAVPESGLRKTPHVKLEDTRRLVTAARVGDTTVFDQATEPEPTLKAIAGALDKAGLSPQGQQRVANDSLRQSLVASLAETNAGRSLGVGYVDGDVSRGGSAILSQLQRYVENKKPVFGLSKISSGKSAVTDIRMLTPNEIREALGVAADEAKEVQRAILDGYTKVPLELRGLGDRVVDYAFKYNPAQKYYARIQSALRYTYNPFFRFQEQVETALLSRMNADKFLWLQPRSRLTEGVEKLTRGGFFDGNLTSAAADDVVFGRISANLTKFQKRNLAGLAMTIADRRGISLDDMIQDHSDELDDALRVIVQYPNKGVLASSLARTINVAFFPMRYNAKVSMMAAKKIAELPPSLQLGVIQGFLKTKEWLQSDEGIRWQSEHADALQVLKWATPVGSIQQFYKVLTGNVEAPGDLGLLGGLPFGVISQMLDSQGIINLNTPYINPRTGEQLPDYIPQATRARAAVAVQDLIGSMFSFPGRTLGMIGKEATLRDAVDIFIDTNGADFEKRLDTENLTPLQKKWMQVLKGDTSEDTIADLYNSPAEGQYNGYTLPPFDLPIKAPTTPVTPPPRRQGLPSSKRGPRKKKIAQPIPER